MPLPLHSAAAAGLTTLALATGVGAQLLRGGDIVVADYQTNSVLRVSPATGGAGVIYTGSPLTGPSGVTVLPNGDVVVADYNGGFLFLIPISGAAPRTLATGLAGPIRCATDRDGTVLVTELTAQRLSRVDAGGTVTLIFQGMPLQRPFGIAVDGDGSYLVVDDRVDTLFRIDRAGTAAVPVWQGAPFQLPQGVAVMANGDYAVFDGLADSVFVVPRNGATPTTLVASPPLGNPCGIYDDFEGGVIVSESSATSNRVVQVNAQGNLSVISQGAPFQNLEDLARVPRLRGPTQLPRGALLTLDLDVPEHPGRPFVLFASQSLYPGFAMPGSDPRHSPIQPDGLFFTSLQLVGWSGLLNGAGMAQASLFLPNLPLPPGFTMFVQGVVVDFRARPNGIGKLTNVHALLR